MKYYITVAAALLLSAVLIFNPVVEAASMSISYNVVSSTIAPLVNVYYPELDETGNPVGNYVIATYEYSFSPQIVFSSFDGYINGTSTAVFTITPSTPTGGNNSGMTAEYIPISFDTVFSSGYTRYSTNGSLEYWLSSYYHNYVSYSTQLRLNSISGYVSYYFTYTGSNAPDPTQYINVNISLSANYSNMAITVDPSDIGMSEIIANGIINAINDQTMPFDNILQVLEDIRTQDQTNYSTIITYLSNIDTFNSTLYTWLTTVLEDDFSYLLDDTTYISAVLNAARNLINSMNSRDSLYYPIFEAALDLANTRLQTLINLMSENPAEAESMEDSINQMESKQAAINDYSLPAAANIMGNANSYVSQGIVGMNLLATILNQPLYILILMTVISLAFVSYLLYGKGV